MAQMHTHVCVYVVCVMCMCHVCVFVLMCLCPELHADKMRIREQLIKTLHWSGAQFRQ